MAYFSFLLHLAFCVFIFKVGFLQALDNWVLPRYPLNTLCLLNGCLADHFICVWYSWGFNLLFVFHRSHLFFVPSFLFFSPPLVISFYLPLLSNSSQVFFFTTSCSKPHSTRLYLITVYLQAVSALALKNHNNKIPHFPSSAFTPCYHISYTYKCYKLHKTLTMFILNNQSLIV